METAADIINALGGTVAVATELELAPTVVSSWKSTGSIPKWRRSELHRMAKRMGVAIPDDLGALVRPVQQAAA